jgi:high affinity Mn2+ porin
VRPFRRGARFAIRRGLTWVLCLAGFAAPARAEEPLWPPWGPVLLGAQVNLIGQRLLPFHSPYAGPNSLKADGDARLSHAYGLYFGAQVTDRLQGYADVEMVRGSGISKATGLGGYTNGDVIRQGTVNLGKAPYIARGFGRYVIPLTSETTPVERGMDQLPGEDPVRRVEIKFGRLAANDDFDQNRYANSARTQFMNWSLFNNTAWDFAADTRGFTNGIVVAWVDPAWTVRAGSYQMPTSANGNVFDRDVLRANGNNLEVVVRPVEGGPVVRLLGYLNQARMGDYRSALTRGRATGATPSVSLDERPGRVKYGFGLNVEQPIADGGETGAFLRLGWNDGRTETFVFTEVDRVVSLGLQVSGARWGREDDRLGIGYAFDAISRPHRDYLAAGGSGFMLGDGRLSYGLERLLEVYYRWQPLRYLQVSPGFQYIQHPGYNRDRGPAYVFSLRLRLGY